MDRTLLEQKSNYAKKLIEKYHLDLTGLTVFTELATKNYLMTSVMAYYAGAFVYAYNPNAEENSPLDRFYIVNNFDAIKEADIITNSGHVRPIDKEKIDKMKSTAVVPLMMMPQQVRTEDIDLKYCKEKEILTIGTDEIKIGIFDSIGFKILKLLFENGFSVWRDKFLIITEGAIGAYISDFLYNLRIDFVIRAPGEIVFSNNVSLLSKDCQDVDAVIIADYYHQRYYFPFEKVKTISVRDFKTNISGDYLGYKVTMELNAASLKVGEVAAAARLHGLSIDETVLHAMANCPASIL